MDLIHFGLIPEFIGRFPVITSTSELTLAELISILYLPTNSIMKQYSFYFALYDIQLLCTEEGNQQIAEIALKKKTGARGLRNIVENILMPAMFLIPSQHHLPPRPASKTGTVPSADEAESDLIQDKVAAVTPTVSGDVKNTLPQSQHPVYHTVVIDERAARSERGVILLTHHITREEYQKLTEDELLRDQRVRIVSLDSLGPHLV